MLHPGLRPPPSWHPVGTYRALVGLLAGVHQSVLLQVRQLREALLADVALEGPLAAVHPQVDLRGGGTGLRGGTQGTQSPGCPSPPLLGASCSPPGHSWSTEGGINPQLRALGAF